MIETTEIRIASYVFYIKYFTDLAKDATIDNTNSEGLIEIIYEPIPPITQKEVDNIINECETELIKWVSVMINLHKHFYSKYYIPLKIYHTVYDISNNFNFKDKVVRSKSYFNIKLKQ